MATLYEIDAEKEQKLKPCKCGKPALVVRKVGGYVISCPNPIACKGNCFTSAKTKDVAMKNWNLIV